MRFARLICIALFALLIGNLSAQTAEEALRAAHAKFQSLESYSATVGYDMGGHRDMGKVFYRGAKFHMDFPEDQTIFDGKVEVNWNKAFATISYPEPPSGPDLSVAGIYTLYNHAYDFSWIDSSATVQKMELLPKDPNSTLPIVRLGLNRKTGLMDHYAIEPVEGPNLDMQILDFKINPVLDDKLFIIDWNFVKRVEDGLVPPIEHEHH